jgi:hypothetical protein
MGGMGRSQSSRFQHYDTARIEQGQIEESERNPGGFSGARRCLKHHVWGSRNSPYQVVNYGINGK